MKTQNRPGRRRSHRQTLPATSSREIAALRQAWRRFVTYLGTQQLEQDGQLLAEIYQGLGLGTLLAPPTSAEWPAVLRDAALRIVVERPAATSLDRRIAWLGKVMDLDEMEVGICTVVARVAADAGFDDLSRILRGPRLNARKIALIGDLPIANVESRLSSRRLPRTRLLRVDSDGEVHASSLLEQIARSQLPPSKLARHLLKPEARSTLARDDFSHIGEQANLAFAFVDANAPGSILLHGPPGTGKSEFARLLADESGARAVFASAEDEEGDEMGRFGRLAEFLVLRSLTRTDHSRLLVMDEADDILVIDRRDGRGQSKLFLNRMIEEAPRPVVFIVNETALLDPAILRRFSLAIEFPQPPLTIRRRIVDRHAKRAGLKLSDSEREGLAALPAAPAVISNAIRAGSNSGAGEGGALAIASGIVNAIEGRPRRSAGLPPVYDPALARADTDLADLAERLVAAPSRRWSLLLAGPSGTGKSAYARHLAERLGVDLILKRGSDLLDMFVGGTEANIAKAFAESARTGGLLLIDEADDFLFDRREATRSWERAQVNEMLRQMEALAAPFVATTNLADRLDPATQRRFTARATFRPLTPEQSAALFARHFRSGLPDSVELHGQTPGDFATVAARADLLGESNPATILRWVREEAAARGISGCKMGF
ncbi:MAG: AAA family ATPase [Nitratireductor sp.]